MKLWDKNHMAHYGGWALKLLNGKYKSGWRLSTKVLKVDADVGKAYSSDTIISATVVCRDVIALVLLYPEN